MTATRPDIIEITKHRTLKVMQGPAWISPTRGQAETLVKLGLVNVDSAGNYSLPERTPATDRAVTAAGGPQPIKHAR